jgi:hypothetical protein
MDPFFAAPGPGTAVRTPGTQTGKTLESGVAGADKGRGNGVEQVLPDEQTVFAGKADGPDVLDVLSQIGSYAGFMLSRCDHITFPDTPSESEAHMK